MQETHNNCFRSKIRSMTLRQAKTGKNQCQYKAMLLLHYILYFSNLFTKFIVHIFTHELSTNYSYLKNFLRYIFVSANEFNFIYDEHLRLSCVIVAGWPVFQLFKIP